MRSSQRGVWTSRTLRIVVVFVIIFCLLFFLSFRFFIFPFSPFSRRSLQRDRIVYSYIYKHVSLSSSKSDRRAKTLTRRAPPLRIYYPHDAPSVLYLSSVLFFWLFYKKFSLIDFVTKQQYRVGRRGLLLLFFSFFLSFFSYFFSFF